VQIVRPIGMQEYFRNLLTTLKVSDILSGLGKSVIFGAITSIVSTFQGFSVVRASTEIPVAGIRAVGQSFMLCIFADVIITLMQYA
jgi:phospholipid/cholesterol/gamma-HCH transport system permease protein